MKWWIIIAVAAIIIVPIKLRVLKSLMNKGKNDEENY
tara:strand:+ start:75 stop:185 length:111 start_codon:yes stop_codon:yes gene_type:complete